MSVSLGGRGDLRCPQVLVVGLEPRVLVENTSWPRFPSVLFIQQFMSQIKTEVVRPIKSVVKVPKKYNLIYNK